MELRTALSAWIDKTFGGIHVQDMFNLTEEVAFSKEEDIVIRNITVALKKYQGYKKSWTEKETFDRWKEEIRQIVGGNIMKLEIKSSEGNELRHIEGMGKNVDGRIYAYRFTITIIKRERKRGEKNEK